MTCSGSDSRNLVFSPRAIKRQQQQQQHTLQKELKRQAKIVGLGCQKGARKAEYVHSNMTRRRKGKAKGTDQEARFEETIQQNNHTSERQGSPSGKEDRPPSFNC